MSTLQANKEKKAADLQKENKVLVLKELIRKLGSDKTECAIINVTKAAPVIENIVHNIDNMVYVKNKQSGHASAKTRLHLLQQSLKVQL